jgi:hypothetical protein
MTASGKKGSARNRKGQRLITAELVLPEVVAKDIFR